jgi:pyridoxal biosynthesis lyase PdxS
MVEIGTMRVKSGLAEMLKGGVIMPGSPRTRAPWP